MESPGFRDKILLVSALESLDIRLTYWTVDPQFTYRRKFDNLSEIIFFEQKDKRWISLIKISQLSPRSGSIFVDQEKVNIQSTTNQEKTE